MKAAAQAACHVCQHSERGAIDLALARGVGCPSLAKKHGISRSSVWRHLRRHLPSDVMARLKGEALTGLTGKVDLESLRRDEGQALLSNLIAVRAKLQNLSDAADAAGDFKAAGAIQSRILETLRTVGELLNSFSESHAQTINSLTISPDYLRLRVSLIAR